MYPSNPRSSFVTARSNSTRRPSEARRAPAQRSRSSSVAATHREFTMILTNSPTILQRRTSFRLRVENAVDSTVAPENDGNQQQTTNTIYDHDINNREDVLINLLRLELSEVIQDYLSRTRRSFPLQFLFDASHIESLQQQQQQQE